MRFDTTSKRIVGRDFFSPHLSHPSVPHLDGLLLRVVLVEPGLPDHEHAISVRGRRPEEPAEVALKSCSSIGAGSGMVRAERFSARALMRASRVDPFTGALVHLDRPEPAPPRPQHAARRRGELLGLQTERSVQDGI
mgnify:CR=1 FL=1